MSALSPYRMAGSHDFMHDNNSNSQNTVEMGSQPFVSLLEFVSEVYQVNLFVFFNNMYYGTWMELIILFDGLVSANISSQG